MFNISIPVGVPRPKSSLNSIRWTSIDNEKTVHKDNQCNEAHATVLALTMVTLTHKSRDLFSDHDSNEEEFNQRDLRLLTDSKGRSTVIKENKMRTGKDKEFASIELLVGVERFYGRIICFHKSKETSHRGNTSSFADEYRADHIQ